MRAMQVQEPGADFVPVEKDMPVPAAGQIRIKAQACGVCHSDAFAKAMENTVRSRGNGIGLPAAPEAPSAGRA